MKRFAKAALLLAASLGAAPAVAATELEVYDTYGRYTIIKPKEGANVCMLVGKDGSMEFNLLRAPNGSVFGFTLPPSEILLTSGGKVNLSLMMFFMENGEKQSVVIDRAFNATSLKRGDTQYSIMLKSTDDYRRFADAYLMGVKNGTEVVFAWDSRDLRPAMRLLSECAGIINDRL
ncbi:hypothetical protein ACQKOE_07280 [Novosphingobium sp. NPDC080210]|uniref:hypothetical protein n=1 Tax=Novosphingobium sp. NPDC080210 TaxID=3390596 RepID=UPI003CFE3E4D